MSAKQDISAIMASLDAMEAVAVKADEALKDGIQLHDAIIILGLLEDWKKLAAAIQEIKDIPAEIQDLDAVEASQIVSKVFSIINKIK